MKIIFNKDTKEFIRWYGTNSRFPDGEFDEKVLNLGYNEDYVNIPDDSDFARLVQANLSN